MGDNDEGDPVVIGAKVVAGRLVGALGGCVGALVDAAPAALTLDRHMGPDKILHCPEPPKLGLLLPRGINP